jgi:hypothetical protein
MKAAVVIVTAALAMLATPPPARADHNAAAPPERSATVDVPGTESSLDVTVKLGLNGFRIGSRVFGRDGYAGGAWLNGETRSDGFSVDGRIERDGKAHNFKLNADIDEWLRRAVRWWGGPMDL